MAKTNLPGLAERLKSARESITPELSQRAVGKLIDRSGPCIGQWELGKSEPGLNDLLTLADMYNVTVEWLLGLDKPNAKMTEAAMLAVRGIGANSVPVLGNQAIVSGDLTAMDYVQASRAYPQGTAFAWTVDTDAMARFAIGDVAVIERTQDLTPGGIFMVMPVGGTSPTLRRCRMDQGRAVFMPDASEFHSYNASEVNVLGRLREIVRHIAID